LATGPAQRFEARSQIVRYFSQPSEVGRELLLQIHVDTKHRKKFAVWSVKRIGSRRESWQDLAFGNLIVATVVLVNAHELTVEKAEIHPQVRIEHACDT
jgi:hypothetical protein